MDSTDEIRLSDHFGYGRLIRFTLPTMATMICTSLYGIVDGLFISNVVGSTAFAAANLIWPFISILLISLPAFMLQCTFQSFFVVAERPKLGFAVSIACGIANMLMDFVAAILIMPLFLGINGIWLAVLAAETAALLVSAACLKVNQKKYQY